MAPDDTVVSETENEECEKKPPDRPSPYRHKSSPTVPTKPRPPLPAKPRPPLPKKPPIAHVKPIANSTQAVGDQKKSSLVRLDSTGKGKAPPPPTPSPTASSPPVPAPIPRLPPKNSPLPSPSESSSSSKRSGSPLLNSSPSKTPPFSKNNIQTKILNSARPKRYEGTISPKEPLKASVSLPALPPKTFSAAKTDAVSSTDFTSEKHMKNKNNLSLHENLGLKQQSSVDQLPDWSASSTNKNWPNSFGRKFQPPQSPPPPLKPKPKPRERPIPKRRVSVRNSSGSIGELKVSPHKPLPPPPPPPPLTIPKSPPPTIPKSPPPTIPKSPPPTIPKSPPPTIPKSPPPTIPKSPPPTILKSPPPTIPKSPPPTIPKSSSPTIPVSNSIDTNNNNADSDCLNNDLSSDDDSWLDFKHDSLSLRSLENAVLSITGWHEKNDNNNNNDLTSYTTENSPSPKILPKRPPVPVRDYKIRSPSVDRSRSILSEKTLISSSTTTSKTRTQSRSEVRSDSNSDCAPIQLPRKSRPTTTSGVFDAIGQSPDKKKTPVRPPRPKHEEIKRTKSKLTASDIQFVHVDFTSSKQAQELGAPILPKPETGKVCPPKPQRKSLVRRSRSDATDLRELSNHDIESETYSQKVSMLSSSPSSSASELLESAFKPPTPLPPKRWYPPPSDDGDQKASLDNIIGVSNDHDYHEIMERQQFNLTLSKDSSPTSNENSKELTPPPLLPPRNYSQDEEEADGNLEVQIPLLPDRNYRENSEDVFSSVQKHYVEMTGANGINSLDSALSHTRPLSSVSQSSLPSDSGSGSMETGNTNSVLTSDSESSEEETESENEKGKRNAKKVFYIAQEIVFSERTFVNILRLLNVDFRKAISEATEKAGRPVIPNNMLNQILDYLPQLQNFNEVLLHDLEERLKEWDQVQMIADIFVKKGPFLKLYVSYISNFENTQTLFDDCCKKYPTFANVVKEFQASPVCGNLAIKHHMLKPIQRNPQYRLLLTDYLRYLGPDSPDYKNAQIALNIVSEVANHVNESMRQEDYIQKLMSIQYSLVGEFEVIKPGRKLVKMGELQKLSRKEMQPRVFILFNDTLLYTTPIASGYKLKNVLKLAGMKVETPTLDDFKNEFSIISIQRSFTVCANTPLERDEWIEAFAKAIEENNLKRNSFEVNRTPVAALEKGFVLGAKAPLWVPDVRVTMCMLCTCGFTFTWRRHHCRACGRVVCGNCSNNKAPLLYLDNKPNRVCDECYKCLKDEVDQQVEQSKSAKEKGEDLKFPVLPELLLSRFQKIRISGRSKTYIHRPAWLKEVHANDQGSTMSGYLKIYKGKKWKRLWFVLKDKVLYRYKASEDTAAISSTPLLGYEVKRFTEDTSDRSGSLDTNSTTPEPRPPNWFEGVEQGLVFELTHTGMPPMRFQTDSTTATEKWVTVMRDASVP